MRPTRTHPRRGRTRLTPAHGFTLLELIVVIALVLVVIGISIPPALSLIQRQRFSAAADAIARAALETRREAIESSAPAELIFVSDRLSPDDPLAALRDASETGGRPRADRTVYEGGQLIVRAFEPESENAARPIAPAAEGAPAASDLFEVPRSEVEPFATFDRDVLISFRDPAGAGGFAGAAGSTPRPPASPESPRDPDSAAEAPPDQDPPTDADPGPGGQPWWMAGGYAEGERPLLIVGPDGLPLWSSGLTVAIDRRSATLAFHPMSGEAMRETEPASDNATADITQDPLRPGDDAAPADAGGGAP